MNLGEANKALWLWLHKRGGYWTAEQMARATGYASQNIFRALFDMSRRNLIEQVDPIPGSRKKRYGVTDSCLVPLGLTVAEVMHGEGVSPPPKSPHARAEAPAAPPPPTPPAANPYGLSASEMAYLRNDRQLERATC
jgi:hypothetical protein